MNADAAVGPATHTLPFAFFQSPQSRFRILSAYWLVVLLGLPLWWITTSMERLTLPEARVRATAVEKEIRFPINVVVEPAPGVSPTTTIGITRDVERFLNQDKASNPTAWEGLDVSFIGAGSEPSKPTYKLEIHPESSATTPSNLWITGRTLHIRQNTSAEDVSLARTAASTLCELLAPYLATQRHARVHERLVTRYSSKFRLAFSLLNEDASAGNGIVNWEQRAAINRYIAPVLSQLGILYNFTLESQVQLYAPLAFDPPYTIVSGGRSYFLTEEELKMFINSAEWTLASSVSEDPVLHFILFSPSPLHRPLIIEDGGSSSNSFVVPQWGSVVILEDSLLPTLGRDSDGFRLSLSDMDRSFKLFRSQLLTLLGVPTLPASVSFESNGGKISEWQLDALLRRRAMENIRDSKEALLSIVKLVDQITGMPVGPDVRNDIQGALDAIDQSYSTAANYPEVPLQFSARANTLSSRAFFNPSMLAMLYFPPEHRFAVYLPLFGPISMPLIVGLVRELKRRREDRRKEKEKKE